jgi:hypothetical protein
MLNQIKLSAGIFINSHIVYLYQIEPIPVSVRHCT